MVGQGGSHGTKKIQIQKGLVTSFPHAKKMSPQSGCSTERTPFSSPCRLKLELFEVRQAK
jgi:hypothetical protein